MHTMIMMTIFCFQMSGNDEASGRRRRIRQAEEDLTNRIIGAIEALQAEQGHENQRGVMFVTRGAVERFIRNHTRIEIMPRHQGQNRYKAIVNRNAVIRVAILGKIAKAAAGGGAAGASLGAVSGGGAGAGIGALIGIIGGPIGVAIGAGIGAGAGAAVGGAAGVAPGAGVGGYLAYKFGEKIDVQIETIHKYITNGDVIITINDQQIEILVTYNRR